MPAKTKPSKPAKPAAFEWPKRASAVLLDYLKANVSADADAPNQARPFINANGVVHLHSTD